VQLSSAMVKTIGGVDSSLLRWGDGLIRWAQVDDGDAFDELYVDCLANHFPSN
jgi:hypothetical protein